MYFCHLEFGSESPVDVRNGMLQVPAVVRQYTVSIFLSTELLHLSFQNFDAAYWYHC